MWTSLDWAIMLCLPLAMLTLVSIGWILPKQHAEEAEVEPQVEPQAKDLGPVEGQRPLDLSQPPNRTSVPPGLTEPASAQTQAQRVQAALAQIQKRLDLDEPVGTGGSEQVAAATQAAAMPVQATPTLGAPREPQGDAPVAPKSTPVASKTAPVAADVEPDLEDFGIGFGFGGSEDAAPAGRFAENSGE